MTVHIAAFAGWLALSACLGVTIGWVATRLTADSRRARQQEDARVLANPLLRRGGGRHRLGRAAGSDAQRQRWDSPTAEFNVMVEAGWTPQEREDLQAAIDAGRPGGDA